jgi:hypothetical protein
MKAYETFHVQDPLTAEMAVEMVEAAFPQIHHPWLPAEDRGEWIRKHGLFYIIFLDGEYRGYFCIVKHDDGSYLHFGTTGHAYALADVRYGLAKAQCIAANVYGITELFCCIDEGSIISKMVSKLGFIPLSGDTYSIKCHYGKEAKKS